MAKVICKYVDAVLCSQSKKNCDTCGWNPKEAERRLAKIMKQRIGGKQIAKPTR